MKKSANDETPTDIDYPALGCQYLLFNFQKPGVHHHPHFRQALRMVYDSAALVAELGENLIRPASSFLPWRSVQQHWSEASLDHAHPLLDSSGYQGETLILSCTANKDMRVAHWIQQRAAAIGLHIEIAASIDNLQPEETSFADLIMAEEILEQDWQYGMIHYFKTSSNQFNACMSPEQTSILDDKLEPFAQLDEPDRISLLNEAEDILRRNCWILHGAHVNKRLILIRACQACRRRTLVLWTFLRYGSSSKKEDFRPMTEILFCCYIFSSVLEQTEPKLYMKWIYPTTNIQSAAKFAPRPFLTTAPGMVRSSESIYRKVLDRQCLVHNHDLIDLPYEIQSMCDDNDRFAAELFQNPFHDAFLRNIVQSRYRFVQNQHVSTL